MGGYYPGGFKKNTFAYSKDGATVTHINDATGYSNAHCVQC